MLDWLRRDPARPHVVSVGGSELPLVIRRLANARRMTMRLAPDGSEVRISMPNWGRTADAVAFAKARSDWLSRQQAALPEPTPLAPGAVLPFRGETLVLTHVARAARKPRPDGQALVIGGPLEGMERRIKTWLQAEARALLEADLAHYCQLAGRPAPRLALSNAQRRWGSCAANGAIRINWRLIMAPDFVRRSVVAHEVAHLVHFDHSPRFHGLLADLFEGDLAAANRWLKRQGRSLYAHFG